MRETSRSLHLKLRDIEVVNDDYERQARSTSSSLEDLEAKYNMAIERGVLLEEEVKNGEQERENLRIENQRLRDELSDLKIEAEITQDKLRRVESQGALGRRRKPISLMRSPTTSTPESPEPTINSPNSSVLSSSLFTTPVKPPLASATATPPSPPPSESPVSMRKSITAMPGFPFQKASGPDSSRSSLASRAHKQHTSRAASIASNPGRHAGTGHHPTLNNRFANHGRQNPSASSSSTRGSASRLSSSATSRSSPLPKSESLNQIRGLIGKMQKLEQRVQTAKSRLPAPSESPSRASNRSGSVSGQSSIPATVTLRHNKRLSNSSLGSSVREGDSTPSYVPPTGRQSGSSRTQGDSRSSSRASFSSRSSFSQSTSTHTSIAPPGRSDSRQSGTSNSRLPLGHYSNNPTSESRRPRSSLSNGHKSPVNMNNGMFNIDEDGNNTTSSISLALRSKPENNTSIPEPTISPPIINGLKKRSASGMSAIPTPRSLMTSAGFDRGDQKSQFPGLGETY